MGKVFPAKKWIDWEVVFGSQHHDRYLVVKIIPAIVTPTVDVVARTSGREHRHLWHVYNGKINQTISQHTLQSINQSIKPPITHSLNQSINRSNKSTNQSINQPVKQINQSINQSVSRMTENRAYKRDIPRLVVARQTRWVYWAGRSTLAGDQFAPGPVSGLASKPTQRAPPIKTSFEMRL